MSDNKLMTTMEFCQALRNCDWEAVHRHERMMRQRIADLEKRVKELTETLNCDPDDPYIPFPYKVITGNDNDDVGGGESREGIQAEQGNHSTRPAPSSDISCGSRAVQQLAGNIGKHHKIGQLLVKDGVPHIWEKRYDARFDKIIEDWGLLSDSPVDLPYQLAWKKFERRSSLPKKKRPHDGLYDVWLVGDCWKCYGTGIMQPNIDPHSEAKCEDCCGDGGRYELRRQEK